MIKKIKDSSHLGKLFGIPILLKDNIDTADQMPCTAGSLLMKDAFPKEDSPIAEQLRDQDAVILGKTNLSKWANFYSKNSSSGWSPIGGQTKNPYKLNHNPCGSSSGSAVAVASNLAIGALGTETHGSIICPSNKCGIIGIKPTVGLISRSGIIPISSEQDTAGPMTRNVTDAAVLLNCLTNVDAADVKTLAPNRKVENYLEALRTDRLKKMRIGFDLSGLAINKSHALKEIFNKALNYFQSEAKETIEIKSPISIEIKEASFQILLHEFKVGINAYLKANDYKIQSLSDLISEGMKLEKEQFNYRHDLLEMANKTEGLQSDLYLKC